MMCIFCLKEKAPSEEHIFPDAIGGLLTTDRVCKGCNDWLGIKIDVLLTDHVAVMMKRNQIQIKNRDGIYPQIDRILKTGTLVSDADQRVKITLDPESGHLQPQLLYKSETSHVGDSIEVTSVTIDKAQIADIGKIIQRMRQRAGFQPLSSTELEREVSYVSSNVQTINNPEIKHELQFDLINYKKAVLKIIYELAWLWLGDGYLVDATAEVMRNAILKKEEPTMRGRITLGVEIPPFNALWRDEPNKLIGFGAKAGNIIFVGVRIFDVTSGIVPVSNDASRYNGYPNGNFHQVDPTTRGQRNTTFSEELMRLSMKWGG